jgi:hypothetical protein
MKPIFTVKIPNSCNSEEEVKTIQEALKAQLFEYHVVVVATQTDEVVFECFNPTTKVWEIK